MITLEDFKTRLLRFLDIKLDLVLNENRSTMLNILEKNRSFARLSVHKMFLDAPDPVLSAIAHYVRGTRKDKRHQSLILRTFIQQHLAAGDYTHLIDRHKLTQQGKIYHLGELYDSLNHTYFGGGLKLSITWYGQVRSRRPSRITFGQYLPGLRLIKIHRMLDDPFFPEYFVSFVVYHEMLHSVVPGSTDGRGQFCFHGRDFKKREMAFEHYRAALVWEKNNKTTLFKK